MLEVLEGKYFFANKPGVLQNRDIQFNNIYTCAIFCTASLVAC